MDMQTGAINYSAPEKALIAIGLGQMTERYSLPSLVADIGFGDEIHPNVAPFNEMAIQIMGVASRTDILTGMGCCDSAIGISFEQLVIDSYIWECIREFMKEVHVTEERIGFDEIKAVGHGHHFLKSKHTRRLMREEITQWNADKIEMLKSDVATLSAESKRIVEQLMKDHEVLPIDGDLIRQGDEIIRAYEGRLAG
jgi:trimethylamine:corrinoid methyltransferase-like protein